MFHYVCPNIFMETTLKSFLNSKKYTRVKLKLTKTNHFEIKASINGIKGLFILDTGASSSCIGFESASFFNLKVKNSNVKAAGAGATDMLTKISKNNTIKIGRFKVDKMNLVLFDLTHVNTALLNHGGKPVDGIIGADVLKKTKAIIDYETKHLYLK